MLRWIWEHIFWPPRVDVRAVRRTQLLEVVLELRTRVSALELDLAKLRGRVVGGLRADPAAQLELPDPEPTVDEQIEYLGQVEDFDSHALGARRRFGKE